jgi:prophage antirepressor-like protein
MCEKRTALRACFEKTPWFYALDVCQVLDIQNVSQAVERVENEEKLMRRVYVSGQNRER